ncbi:MAG: SRPBCC family protein [Ardenticatenaceae bacterium]|nr:SRPBCC family protein [Ardenticatenaceae bacterium]
MIIEDTFTIDASVQDVWTFFFDLERMSACMPGVERIQQLGEARYEGALKVKVGPIGAAFGGEVVVVEQQAPTFLKAVARGKDRATASLVQGEFVSTLTGRGPQQTEVAYTMDVAIRGRLGSFGHSVIQETARRLSAEFIRCVKARIEAPGAEAATQSPPSVAGIAAKAVVEASREALNDKARAVGRWMRRDPSLSSQSSRSEGEEGIEAEGKTPRRDTSPPGQAEKGSTGGSADAGKPS